MSQSGELINATLQCIGDSSDNVHCTRTHQTIRPGFQIALTHLSACPKTRRSLQNLKNPVTHQSDCKDSSDLCHHCGDSLQRDTNNMVGRHKAEGSENRWLIRLQGPRSWLDAKVALAPQGWRTSHVWWFCKVGSATAPRCWRRECFEPIYKFWRQKSD